jgi:hypothetical protein
MTDPLRALTTYELRHLPRHLAEAGRVDDLHRLLSLEREPADGNVEPLRLTGRSINTWYVAATHDGGQRLYLDQLEVATRSAEQATAVALRAGQGGAGAIWEFHYALSAASVRNVSANIPVRLLASLMRRGLLSQDEALSHVRQIPDALQRAEGLTNLMRLLDEEAAADVAGEALAAVSNVEDEFWRVGALGTLAPDLPVPLQSHARLIADRITHPFHGAVAQALVGREVDSDLRTRLIAGSSRTYVPPDQSDLAGTDLSFRSEYMDQYAERGEQAARNLREFLHGRGADSISSPYWLAEAYAALVDESDDYLQPAVSAAGAVGGYAAQVDLLRAVVLRLAALGHVSEAEELLTEGLLSPVDRLLMRCELAAAGAARVNLAELAELPDPWTEIRAFRILLPVLDEPDRARVVEELMPKAGDDVAAGRLMVATPYLHEADWQPALRGVAMLTDDEQRMRVRGGLAAQGVALGHPRAFDPLAQIGDEYWYMCALDQVVPALLRRGRTDEALARAATAPYPHRRAALTALCAVALPEPKSSTVRTEAYEIAASLASSTSRVRALVLVAEALGGDAAVLLAEAANAAREMDGQERLQADAMAAVANALAASGHVNQALDLADSIVNEHSLATATIAAAGHAGATDLSRVLSKARSISARRERGRALTALACRAALIGPNSIALHDHWREALRTIALGGREDFLVDVIGLLPVAEVLGGSRALVDIVGSSRRIARWWP